MNRLPPHRCCFLLSASVSLGTLSLLLGCSGEEAPSLPRLGAEIDSLIEASGEEVAVYYQSVEGSDALMINPDLRMHAASTMKVPVMARLFLDHQEGRISLEDSLEVRTTFRSIVDGSPYTLSAESDSDTTLYGMEGERVGYRELIELMITLSSNLATNILIEEADPERVTELMRSLGADSIQVLRGVEDIPAFRAGLSNTTTARDLGILLLALARGEVGSEALSAEMVEVLERQHWNTKIPAGLPPGTRVAHKTGWITEISHDAGIVYPEGAPPYVVVILTRGFEENEEAEAVAARISRRIHDYHVSAAGS